MKSSVHNFYKAYEKLSLKNVGHVTALGDICNAIQQVPTSTVLSQLEFLKINERVHIDSGDLSGIPVAIKVFRSPGKVAKMKG